MIQNNPLAAYGIKAVDLHGRDSSAVFSEKVEGARVVKAFNHLDVRTLVPKSSNGSQTVLFFSGDEPQAKSEVRALLGRAGFFPVDLGSAKCWGATRVPSFWSTGRHRLYKGVTRGGRRGPIPLPTRTIG